MIRMRMVPNKKIKAEIQDNSYYLAKSNDDEDCFMSSGSNHFFAINDNKYSNDDILNDETSEESTSPMLSKKDEMRYNTMNSCQRTYTLILYSITTVLLFADQNLLAPNLSAAAEEFGYDNDERDKKLGGDIALAFFLLGAPASFLVGCGADSDSVSRNFLFGLTVLIGEGSCCLTYFTESYAGLYITRALTGFSVGGALPLLSSVLGDWFPPQQRSAVMASVGIGSGLGIAIGQGIAGYMGPIYGWRSPFLVVSIPALLVAILLMTTVKDPVRGGSEIVNVATEQREEAGDLNGQQQQHGNDIQNEIDVHVNSNVDIQNESVVNLHNDVMPTSPLEVISYDSDHESNESNDNDSLINEETNNNVKTDSRCKQLLACLNPRSYASHLQTTKELLQSKTVLLILLQGAPGCIPWGIINTFLNDYLSENCGLSVQAATTFILIFGIGNFLGMVLGGAGGDFLYKKDPRYPTLFSGTLAILGCFPLWILVNTTNVPEGENISTWLAFRTGLISLVAGIGSGVTGPIVKATLQNVTLPNARGQAFALLNTFDDFGRGLGPVFVAAMIIALGGRQVAFNVGISGWILCGMFNILIFFTVKADEEDTKQKFLQRYESR